MLRWALPNVRAIALCAAACCAMVASSARAQSEEIYDPLPEDPYEVVSDEAPSLSPMSADQEPLVAEPLSMEHAEELSYPNGAPEIPFNQQLPIDQSWPYLMHQDGSISRRGAYLGTAHDEPPPYYCRCLTRMGFRHSYTHGRNVGWGQPMVGTSWMNRPYYYGASLGPMWFTNRINDSVGRDADLMGTIFFGWDWDYYWGSEFQYCYATPELKHSTIPDAPLGHRLASWNYSFMYYPWGDAAIRPYWRLGVGNTKFDFPTPEGSHRDEWLFTTPFGVGLKYPLRRWLATRVEFVDQYSWGGNGAASQHNLTLNFGIECHFGGYRKNYFPWNPSYKMH